MSSKRRRISALTSELVDNSIRLSGTNRPNELLFFQDKASGKRGRRTISNKAQSHVKLYTRESPKAAPPQRFLSAETRSRAALSSSRFAPPMLRVGLNETTDLWENDSSARRSQRSSAQPAVDMPSWAVCVGRGRVAAPGLSYNPDAVEHAAVIKDASSAEERAMLQALLLAARLQPSDQYETILSAVVLPSDNVSKLDADGDAEFTATVLSGSSINLPEAAGQSGHLYPSQLQQPTERKTVARRYRDSATKVAQALRLTVPLASELSGSLRGMKPVGAQVVAAERMAALVLSTGQVPVRSSVRDGVSTMLLGDAVLVRKQKKRRSFPYKLVEFPRQAPALQALSQAVPVRTFAASNDVIQTAPASTSISHGNDSLVIFFWR